MKASQVLSLSTDARFVEFDTAASEELDTKDKNEKIIFLINKEKQQKKDSSESIVEWIDQHYYSPQQGALTYIYQDFKEYERLMSSIKEIIGAYIDENIISNLKNINQWLVKEYTVYDSIDLLHSLVDVGKEIFREARPRNELESKSINSFIRSKTKTISIK